jgi:predicted GIY-YIG superfamily endonuclease
VGRPIDYQHHRQRVGEMNNRDYLVYVLVSIADPRKTYVGCTNAPKRRLRQHCGEITGGARFTRQHRPWRFALHVTGLTRREALQLEWASKHRRVPGISGLRGRVRTVERLLSAPKHGRWTSNAPLLSTIRHHIKVKHF